MRSGVPNYILGCLLLMVAGFTFGQGEWPWSVLFAFVGSVNTTLGVVAWMKR